MQVNALICFCTCPDTDTAERLAEALVEERLAACVNILPGLRSVYRWQAEVERADETLLLIKTTAGRYADLEAAVRAQHPYEVPEIIALPVVQGLPDYLAWLNAETQMGGWLPA